MIALVAAIALAIRRRARIGAAASDSWSKF
jgi:hypothetical protein